MLEDSFSWLCLNLLALPHNDKKNPIQPQHYMHFTHFPAADSVPKSLQNYPNPFNPITHLEFGIPNLGFVTLKVYDVLGREIKTLLNEIKPAGKYKIEFDGSNFASGVYFYRLEAGDFVETKRMVLIK